MPYLRFTLIIAALAAVDLSAQSPRVMAARTQQGALTRGDEQLDTGEFVDTYTYRWQAGQRVRIELSSTAFDGYLVLVPPKGDQIENDDAEDDDSTRSVIETDLTESGTYEVLVTSFEEGETGDYTLRVSASPARRSTTAITTLAFGETRDEELTPDDRLLDERYVDVYAFSARAGERIAVEMTSNALDTYLTLFTPDGNEIENDDANGDNHRSEIALTLRETGQYRLLASSYGDRQSGRYRLTLRRSAAARDTDASSDRAGASAADREPRLVAEGGRIYGVFVGISDYEGDDNDLEYTADDARAIHRALSAGAGLRDGDAVTLLDDDATRTNVRRAVDEIGRRAGPDDLFVFFYSGHGDRVARAGHQPADPDGLDETITLYDGDMTDDEMNEMLSTVRARVLFVLDSCFSGGFSKDIISAPRRMGLFSSEEDVTSGVADKFRAGGYLSKFMADGISERRADKDRDGAITAIELSQYLHERYRSDVKSSRSGTENFVSTGRDTGYQHLVVDRGSIGPFDVLFRR